MTVKMGPCVVLVHGLAAHRVVMIPLQRHLQQAGYQTVNWGYRSIRGDIIEHGNQLRQLLARLEQDLPGVPLHLVTHSMGCIIGRVATDAPSVRRLQRWVMLAPPNHGSPVAARLSPWLGWICPSLRQLSDGADSLVNRLPQPSLAEIGVISARSDWVVPATSTYVDGQQDWLEIPGFHSGLLWQKETARQVMNFLERGQFHRDHGSTSLSTAPCCLKPGDDTT